LNEDLQASVILLAEVAVCLFELLNEAADFRIGDILFQRCRRSFHAASLSAELVRVLLKLIRIVTANQNIFPGLHLFFERDLHLAGGILLASLRLEVIEQGLIAGGDGLQAKNQEGG